MDTRFKLLEIKRFFKNLKVDYRSVHGPTKKEKRKSYLRLTKQLFMNIWNGVSAPFIYPFWYLFKKQITNKIYNGTSWEIINKLVEENKTVEVKNTLKKNGRFWYWLWTYGDLRDPLGEGEIVGYGVKNNFWNRYKENAFRNPRFTINFMEFNTGDIVEIIPIIDTRDYSYLHRSWGLGDKPDGIQFDWMKDTSDRWYFVYRDINEKNFFYCGYVGLGSFGRKYTRFETSYRRTDSSYRK
jgi:hypothetical protein